ncbi:MAG: glutaredoxin 3 [Methylophilaceae bacterium]|nr:glutaredoxin 3 [Methylophilaceae bacterium]
MNKITMYTTSSCPFCRAAEQLLQNRGYTEISFIRVDLDMQQRVEMMTRTGRRTVPQIYFGDYHVGGFDDLQTLDRAGDLHRLLKTEQIA